MKDLIALYHERIGWTPEGERLHFHELGRLLERAAWSIPFENKAIIENRTEPVTRDSLVRKILVRDEGGLCYELNPLLYYFLQENGFDVKLLRGAVYQTEQDGFVATGRTHITILLTHEGRAYLVDTGFGGNLPLVPVPLDGEIAASMTGRFRVAAKETKYGNYVFQMILKHKDVDWRNGYAFDTRLTVDEQTELDEVQSIIAHHPESRFNKQAMITRLNERGSVTLTENSLTRRVDGEMTKEPVAGGDFAQLEKLYFG